MTPPEPILPQADPAEALHAIARRLADPWFGAGPLATLRRLDPGGSLAEPALQRLLAWLPEPWLGGGGERAWALLVHCLALAAPDLHRGGASLGAALRKAGYSEGRLIRLLQARPANLLVVLPHMVRFLVAKRKKLDLEGLCRLVMAGARGDAPAAEATRTAIARAYYRVEAAAFRGGQDLVHGGCRPMTSPRFVQIHTLSAYPAVLLNRDDAGLAERMPFGGASRLRVSSQCLKRHWSTAEDEWSLKAIGAPMAVRSREVVEREIMPHLAGLTPQVAEAVRVALVKKLYGERSIEVTNRQALLLGRPEIDYTARLAREAVEGANTPKAVEAGIEARLGKGDGKRNLAAMREVAGDLAAGLESALFGRMVTSDPEANTEAAIHVAHAFTFLRQKAWGVSPGMNGAPAKHDAFPTGPSPGLRCRPE